MRHFFILTSIFVAFVNLFYADYSMGDEPTKPVIKWQVTDDSGVTTPIKDLKIAGKSEIEAIGNDFPVTIGLQSVKRIEASKGGKLRIVTQSKDKLSATLDPDVQVSGETALGTFRLSLKNVKKMVNQTPPKPQKIAPTALTGWVADVTLLNGKSARLADVAIYDTWKPPADHRRSYKDRSHPEVTAPAFPLRRHYGRWYIWFSKITSVTLEKDGRFKVSLSDGNTLYGTDAGFAPYGDNTGGTSKLKGYLYGGLTMIDLSRVAKITLQKEQEKNGLLKIEFADLDDWDESRIKVGEGGEVSPDPTFSELTVMLPSGESMKLSAAWISNGRTYSGGYGGEFYHTVWGASVSGDIRIDLVGSGHVNLNPNLLIGFEVNKVITESDLEAPVSGHSPFSHASVRLSVGVNGDATFEGNSSESYKSYGYRLIGTTKLGVVNLDLREVKSLSTEEHPLGPVKDRDYKYKIMDAAGREWLTAYFQIPSYTIGNVIYNNLNRSIVAEVQIGQCKSENEDKDYYCRGQIITRKGHKFNTLVRTYSYGLDVDYPLDMRINTPNLRTIQFFPPKARQKQSSPSGMRAVIRTSQTSLELWGPLLRYNNDYVSVKLGQAKYDVPFSKLSSISHISYYEKSKNGTATLNMRDGKTLKVNLLLAPDDKITGGAELGDASVEIGKIQSIRFLDAKQSNKSFRPGKPTTLKLGQNTLQVWQLKLNGNDYISVKLGKAEYDVSLSKLAAIGDIAYKRKGKIGTATLNTRDGDTLKVILRLPSDAKISGKSELGEVEIEIGIVQSITFP